MAGECQRLGVKTAFGGAQEFEQRLPFAAIANCLGPSLDTDDGRLARLAALLSGAEVLGQSIAAANHEFVVIEADLLADNGRRLLFRHDLIRGSLAAQMPHLVRAALHLRAGQVLAIANVPVERAAEHLLAGTVLDEKTVQWVLDSAADLTVRAPLQAVSLLRRVLVVADDAARDALRFHLVRALLWVGILTEAERETRAVPGDGGLHWLLVQAVYRQGRLAGTVEVIEAALASPHLTPAEVGRFHGFGATCLFYLERFEEGERSAREAIEIGKTHGDPQAGALGHLALAAARFAHGDMLEALRHTELTVPAFERGISPTCRPIHMRCAATACWSWTGWQRPTRRSPSPPSTTRRSVESVRRGPGPQP